MATMRILHLRMIFIVAIFYPFSQFCEIIISLPSLQTQPNAAPNLFQRGVEYGKYEDLTFENDIDKVNDTNDDATNDSNKHTATTYYYYYYYYYYY